MSKKFSSGTKNPKQTNKYVNKHLHDSFKEEYPQRDVITSKLKLSFLISCNISGVNSLYTIFKSDQWTHAMDTEIFFPHIQQ